MITLSKWGRGADEALELWCALALWCGETLHIESMFRYRGSTKVEMLLNIGKWVDMESNADPAVRPMVTAAWLCERLSETSAGGIAATLSRLIREGDIAAGSQLPTVRALASRMGVSPATVSAAWNTLRKQRIIEGSGRQGTWVLDKPTRLGPVRYENIRQYWNGNVLDLSLAAPDPSLLPDPVRAMEMCTQDPELNRYERPSITTALQKAAEPTWPWLPEAWMAVNGGYEGLLLALSSWVVPGDYIAVADPSAPRILDILEHIGARLLPIATDDDGPRPDKLKQALRLNPVAFIYEPTASSRLGISIGPARQDELAQVLRGSKLLIVEDDGLGELASAPYCGLGPLYPDRTVLVRSYSKSHGPDLRLAIMGGAAEAISRSRDIRQFGAGWTSRLLQNALAWMLEDPEVKDQIDRARKIYRRRREMMSDLLEKRDINVQTKDGLSIFVPVLSEQQALLVLASHGVAALGGSGSAIRSHSPMVRLSVGVELDNPEHIADVYSMAAKAF